MGVFAIVGTAITAVISFISTNIDNIFVMMLLYAQAGEKSEKRHVVIGQYVALALLVAISLLGAVGFHFVPSQYVGFLGVIPMALGVREWLSYQKSQRTAAEPDGENSIQTAEGIAADGSADAKGRWHQILTRLQAAAPKIINPDIASVVIVAVANGADNIGVYIPLFTGYAGWQLLLTILVFAAMMALWCFLGERITAFPKIKNTIQRIKHIAVPIIFVGLGIYIIIKGLL